MVSDTAFIFHVCIPWNKTLSLVPTSESSVKEMVFNINVTFKKEKKTSTLGITFEW